MSKKFCLVHANCQGPPLIERLMTCPEFAANHECVLYTNYTREPVPDHVISQCDLFLYQHLGPGWGELASEALLAKLPQSAAHLCIPNMFFKGYWPLWSGEEGFDFRCSHLDEILDRGLAPEEAALLFIHSDVATRFDLLTMVKQTIELERERERHTPVKYLDVIIKNYRDLRLFNTVNHPGSLLTNHVARGVLEQLGYTPPDPGVFESLGEPFPEFEQPINPKIGQFFGWDFAKPDTEYTVYGRKMSFARYVSNYVMARQTGVADFIGFLQGAHIAI